MRKKERRGGDIKDEGGGEREMGTNGGEKTKGRELRGRKRKKRQWKLKVDFY